MDSAMTICKYNNLELELSPIKLFSGRFEILMRFIDSSIRVFNSIVLLNQKLSQTICT